MPSCRRPSKKLKAVPQPFYKIARTAFLCLQPNAGLITAHTQHRRTNAEHNIRNNLQNTAVPDNCPHGNRCIDYIIGYYIEPYESKQINNYHTNKICFQQATEINLLSLARPGFVYPCLHDKARKAENLKHDYAATQKRDEFRLRGDLITANLYRMKSGEKVLHAENYYEDGCPTIDIPLDPLLSPQQNAAKNYKQYNKLKTAEFHLREQIEKAENERAYLESVLQELSQAETEQEFNEIRRELQETNYIRKSSGKKELKRAFAPRTFKTSSGLEVLVGRSNVQNDQLTKKADKRDYWFHTQHIHGSHVILRCAGLTPSDDDLREAAMLASYFSQAKESSSVPVDYCPVKFVKKPAGARPGMVTYDNYRTLYVTPEEGLVKKLFLR